MSPPHPINHNPELPSQSECRASNITDSNEKNGCMRMWSGSHKDNLKDHDQKFNEGNLLTRGQTVNDVPEHETKALIL